MTKIEWTVCTLQEVDDSRAVSKRLKEQMCSREDKQPTDANAPRERFLDTTNIHDLLMGNLEHPRWARSGRAMPGMWQLHVGVPDLLLLHR